jgi:uncharacterized protein
MKTLRSLVIPALILSTLGACSSHARDATPLAAGSALVVVGSQEAQGLAVLGRGEVISTPDTAFIELGVEAHGGSVAKARASGAKAMNALIDSATKNGVARADIQTSQLSIDPRYDGSGSRITGYTMTTSVTIKLRDLDKLSKTIDDAVDAGGNASRVSAIRFGVRDSVLLRDRARESAIHDARRKAEQIAKVSGSKLGSLVAIEELMVTTPPMPMLTVEGGEAQHTPIERGSATISVEVRVRWALAG